MLQSLDGSIRISAIPAGQDGEGNEIIDADMSVTSKVVKKEYLLH